VRNLLQTKEMSTSQNIFEPFSSKILRLYTEQNLPEKNLGKNDPKFYQNPPYLLREIFY
jgi:hypothetical protein